MTEIETEVKIENGKNFSKDSNFTKDIFSAKTFGSNTELKQFESYKPLDLNAIYNNLSKTEQEKPKKEYNFEDDVDFNRLKKLENKNAPAMYSETVIEPKQRATIKINLRGKLVIMVASVTFILFAFLAIFNAITITNLNKNITKLNAEIIAEQRVLNEMQQTYNLLTDEERLKLKATDKGFVDYDSSQIFEFNVSEQISTSSAGKTSNWFNEFCNWISALFGA